MNLNFSDFEKQDVKFDINELQNAYKEILKIKDFSGPEGISNFGAISLTQIPGDPDSIKGHKARGVFWTKPNSSGEEVLRDEKINEAAYSEFIEEYKNTFYLYHSSEGKIHISNDLSINSISVYNEIGKLILSQEITNMQSTEINIGDRKGLFFVSIKDTYGLKTKSIFVR